MIATHKRATSPAALLCAYLCALSGTAGCAPPAPYGVGLAYGPTVADLLPHWPTYVTLAENSPLHETAAAQGRPVGSLREGTRVEVGGALEGTHIGVHAEGAMEVWGFAPFRALEVTACSAITLEGTPALATRGDRLGLRGAEAQGNVLVEAAVYLRGGTTAQSRHPFTGRVPMSALCTRAPADTQAIDIPGEPASLPAHTTVPLHASPGGPVLVTVPANEWGHVVYVRERRAGWVRVLAGEGPYVDAWAPAQIGGVDTVTLGALGGGGLGTREDRDPVPLVLRTGRWRRAEQPLHRVPRGVEVVLNRLRIARLNAEGWARVQGERDGYFSVTVAADNDAWVNGWIPTSALGPLVEAGRAPTAEAPPSTTH